MAGESKTQQLAPGILSQDAMGHALMADGYFTQSQVIGSAAGVKFGVGAKPLVQAGAPQQNRLFLATLPTEGDWISIEGTDGVVVPYEFRSSTPPVGGTAGRIWVYFGIDAAAARVNLVDAINSVTDAARIAPGAVAPLAGFVARDAVVQTSVMIMEIAGSETARNVTAALSAVADIWDQATTDGGMLETRQFFGVKQLTINANHIAAGHAIFSTGFQPHWAIIINHNRPQNEAWAIVTAANAVVLTLAGGASPNNQPGDTVSCIGIE